MHSTLKSRSLLPLLHTPQRFAQSNALRRTILELIANELIKIAPPRLPDGSLRGGSSLAATLAAGGGGGDGSSDAGASSPHSSSLGGDDSSHGGTVFPMSPEQGSLLSPREGGGMGVPAAARRRSAELPGSLRGGPHVVGSPLMRQGSFPRSPSAQQLAVLARAATRGHRAATVHGPGEFWRVMRQASELAAMGKKRERGGGSSCFFF